MQRITWNGIALHGGPLPGYAASHGCVRMPYGFAEKLFAMRAELLRAAAELAERCGCEAGCPSCVGPSGVVGERGKEHAVRLAASWQGEGGG